jgi:hypothetical protein
MRKKYLLALFTILSITVNAQDYDEVEPVYFKPFRVDVFAGAAFPASNIFGAGAMLGVEPKYALSSAINTGLRLEAAGLVRSFYKVNLNEQKVQADLTLMGSSLLTTDYYFNSGRDIRFFAGLGAGAYWYGAASFAGTPDTNTDPVETKAGVRFGMMPRIGVEGYHVRVSTEYNFVGKAGRTKNSYLALKLGFYFGGGKIKEAVDD